MGRISNLLETKLTIKLDGKEYQFNQQNALKFLIDFQMDNPDLGEPMDYNNDNQRRAYYKKELKGLDIETTKQLISDYFNDDNYSIKDLKKKKVIN